MKTGSGKDVKNLWYNIDNQFKKLSKIFTKIPVSLYLFKQKKAPLYKSAPIERRTSLCNLVFDDLDI